MKTIVKYTLSASFIFVLLLYLSTTLGVSAQKRNETGCHRLKVILKDSLKNNFISEDEVRLSLDKEYGKYIGQPIGEVNLVKVEDIINSKSAVSRSEAYVTADGTLNIEITNREPIVRFQKGNSGFYADKDAYIFPLQENYSSYVTIIDGNIPLKVPKGFRGQLKDRKEAKWLESAIEMVSFMSEDHFWKNVIVQISVNEEGDIIMIPRRGNERFIFGHPDHYREKFSQMAYYYTAIVPEKGKDYYKTINVKYHDQIICRK